MLRLVFGIMETLGKCLLNVERWPGKSKHRDLFVKSVTDGLLLLGESLLSLQGT